MIPTELLKVVAEKANSQQAAAIIERARVEFLVGARWVRFDDGVAKDDSGANVSFSMDAVNTFRVADLEVNSGSPNVQVAPVQRPRLAENEEEAAKTKAAASQPGSKELGLKPGEVHNPAGSAAPKVTPHSG